MNRDITNKINYFLDNWVPPGVRDNKAFVQLLFRIVIGRKYYYYMDFKEKLPTLSEGDINRYYEILCKTFINRKTHCNRACIDRIIRETRGNVILDAAGGAGYIAKILYERDCSLDCTVSDIVLPDKDNRTNGIKYIKGSITKLPFDDNQFDTVICTHALEHIKDEIAALDEIRRVCRRRLLIVLPKQREYRYTYDLHINFYPYRYNVEMLMNSGNKGKRKSVLVELLSNDWMITEEMNDNI